MKDLATLQAKRINYGQSLIWLEVEGREVTPSRTIATNEVDNIVRRHCPKEIYDRFYEQYHSGVGNVASLSMPDLDTIATDLKLKP